MTYIPSTYLQKVKRYICVEHSISEGELLSSSRTDRISHPRQEAMLLLMLGGYSSPKAARSVNRNDHTSALHAWKAVHKRDPKRYMDLFKVSESLQGTGEIKAPEPLKVVRPALYQSTRSRLAVVEALNADLKEEIKELKLKVSAKHTSRFMRDKWLRADKAYGVHHLNETIAQQAEQAAHDADLIAELKAALSAEKAKASRRVAA